MNDQTDPITDADAVIDEMPDLRIEVSHSEQMVILEQRSATDSVQRIAIHRLQAWVLADHFQLQMRGGPNESKVIAMLARRLQVLHERIDQLSHYLHHCSDAEHADLSWEMTFSMATAQIADEFVADLPDLLHSAGAQSRTEPPGAGAGMPPAAAVASRTPRAAPQGAAAPVAQKELL